MSKKLNTAQQKAVCHETGPMLVLGVDNLNMISPMVTIFAILIFSLRYVKIDLTVQRMAEL